MCARRRSRKEKYRKRPKPPKPPLTPEDFDHHHRKAKADGGGNAESNISLVRVKHHRAFHMLFGTGTPEEVAEILNKTWIDPTKKLIVRDR